MEDELNARTNKANNAWNKFKTFWKQKHISTKTKLKIYNSIVVTTLLYGSETWTLTTEQAIKLDSFGTKCLRHIMGYKWDDKIRNEDLYKLTSQVPITKQIQRKRLQWFGHMIRMDENRIAKKINFWQPIGKGKRGRKKKSWQDMIEEDAEELRVGIEYLQSIAQDRRKWLKTINALQVQKT